MEPNRPIQPKPVKTASSMWTIISIIVVIAIIVGIYFMTRSASKNVDTINETPIGLDDMDNSTTLGADRTAVTAMPKSLDVVNLQSFPYKVQAKVSLDLPNSCSSAVGSVTQSGKIFTITMTASQPKDAMCAQVITPVTATVDIPVAGLSAGTYTVNYATFSKTFTLAQNNTVEYTSDK